MSSPALSRPWRVARASGAAVASAATGLATHVLSGGTVAPVVGPAILLGAFGIGWWLSARRISGGQVLGLLVLCQAVVHVGSADGQMAVGGWAMLGGHAAASVVSTLVILRGERWAWALADTLLLRAARLTDTPRVPWLQGPRPWAVLPSPLTSCAESHVLMRGPPVPV